MKRGSFLPGLAAISFSVLTVVAIVWANEPGGTYDPSASATYLAKGHRPAVFVSGYLAVLGILGLIYLLVYLRDLMGAVPGNQRAASIFFATGLVAAASMVLGWAVITGQVIAHAEGGTGGHKVVIAPAVTYLISDVAVNMIFGAGAIFLGVALIILWHASRMTLPVWLRWLTLVAGVLGLAGPAFFPAFFLIIWGLAIGVWLLTAARGTDSAPVPG